MASPAFQFYPNDWLSSAKVTLMSLEQQGAYMRLLAFDWTGNGIPDDDEELAGLSLMRQGWFKGGSVLVRRCFGPHPTRPGFLTNPRLQTEREKQEKWRKKSSDGGLKSAQCRALQKQVKGGAGVVQPKVNSSSSSSIYTTPTPSKGEREFEEFYLAYPKKRHRNDARRAWDKLKPPLSECLRAIAEQKKSEEWKKEGGQFIPYPASWLNSGGWQDEVGVNGHKEHWKGSDSFDQLLTVEPDPEIKAAAARALAEFKAKKEQND